MLWANPSKAHVLLITAARASRYWLPFCDFFCQVCVCLCVCTGFTFLKHDATSLFGKYLPTFVMFYLCLTYLSMCHLLQDGCSSFDIALEVGKKIKSLQVATCGASSEKDKKLDFYQIYKPNFSYWSCFCVGPVSVATE